MLINKAILKKRKELNLTQIELGKMLNVSQESIVKWEAGEEYPCVEKLEMMSKLFGVTIDELINGCENNASDCDKYCKFICENSKKKNVTTLFIIISLFFAVILLFGMALFLLNISLMGTFDTGIHMFSLYIIFGTLIGLLITIIIYTYITFVKKKKNDKFDQTNK